MISITSLDEQIMPICSTTVCPQNMLKTHYRPAMPFGNRKNYFRGSFLFCIVTMQKKLSPLWKPEIYLFRHSQSLKLRNLMGKNPSNFS